jgi:hypothetical protein|tara:strand:- start:6654 stop:7259 length:606 start_codon:yes stop_codon:yes gene_type:complete
MLKNLASKLNKQVKKVNLKGTMQDKRVLYAVGLLSLLYVLFLANEKDFNSVFVFAIVGFLLSFFTKNMILILIVALLFTHFIKFTIHYKKEGMENKKKEGLKSKKEGMEDKEEEKEEDSKEEKEEEPKLDKVEVDEDLPENKDMSEEEKKQKKEEYDKLKKEFVEFQSIQKDILKNMQEIDPLLNKAENFINKFEHYKKKK